ncbi:MAG TPA: hypothetical protein VF523_07475, partial [Burkholderiales bacterium]
MQPAPFMRSIAAATALMLALCGCSVRQIAANRIGDAVAQGGASFASDDDPELIRAAAPANL